jgi:hypothetical protein
MEKGEEKGGGKEYKYTMTNSPKFRIHKIEFSLSISYFF